MLWKRTPPQSNFSYPLTNFGVNALWISACSPSLEESYHSLSESTSFAWNFYTDNYSDFYVRRFSSFKPTHSLVILFIAADFVGEGQILKKSLKGTSYKVFLSCDRYFSEQNPDTPFDILKFLRNQVFFKYDNVPPTMFFFGTARKKTDKKLFPILHTDVFWKTQSSIISEITFLREHDLFGTTKPKNFIPSLFRYQTLCMSLVYAPL